MLLQFRGLGLGGLGFRAWGVIIMELRGDHQGLCGKHGPGMSTRNSIKITCV